MRCGVRRCSTHVFLVFQRVGFDESRRRVRIQEGNTAELYGLAAVDLDFVGEARVTHHYYTSNKTRSLLGEQGRVLIGVGSRHHRKNATAMVQWHVC